MATKKQKRAAGEAKQAANRAESERLGRLAQERARQREAAERKKRADKIAADQREQVKKKTREGAIQKLAAAVS